MTHPVDPIAAVRALIPGSRHRVRLSRIREGADKLVYEGADRLYIERAGDGRVVVITTRDHEWAEGREEDAAIVDGRLVIVVEDYALELIDESPGGQAS